MIFAASWTVSARVYSLFRRFAPINIVIRRVHTRDGITWAPLVGLAGVAVYGLLLVATATVVDRGGPAWVNLIVLVAFWDAVKFAWLIPASLIRLLRVATKRRSSCAPGSTPAQPSPRHFTRPAWTLAWPPVMARWAPQASDGPRVPAQDHLPDHVECRFGNRTSHDHPRTGARRS